MAVIWGMKERVESKSTHKLGAIREGDITMLLIRNGGCKLVMGKI